MKTRLSEDRSETNAVHKKKLSKAWKLILTAKALLHESTLGMRKCSPWQIQEGKQLHCCGVDKNQVPQERMLNQQVGWEERSHTFITENQSVIRSNDAHWSIWAHCQVCLSAQQHLTLLSPSYPLSTLTPCLELNSHNLLPWMFLCGTNGTVGWRVAFRSTK